MKFQEISQKSVPELQKDLLSARAEMNGLKIKNRLGQVKNTRQMGVVRRSIAQMLTALKLKS